MTTVATVIGCVLYEVCADSKEKVWRQEQLLQLTGAFSGRYAWRGKKSRASGMVARVVECVLSQVRAEEEETVEH